MTKSECGRMGGTKTASKYGAGYMRELAKKGAKAFHDKYKLQPIGSNDFAVVERATGKPTGKTINGLVFNG